MMSLALSRIHISPLATDSSAGCEGLHPGFGPACQLLPGVEIGFSPHPLSLRHVLIFSNAPTSLWVPSCAGYAVDGGRVCTLSVRASEYPLDITSCV